MLSIFPVSLCVFYLAVFCSSSAQRRPVPTVMALEFCAPPRFLTAPALPLIGFPDERGSISVRAQLQAESLRVEQNTAVAGAGKGKGVEI